VSIENGFDVPFVAALAQREKQIQQNYRPIIAVHKWFARRPGTLFRSLLLAEFVAGPLCDRYFQSHRLDGVRVADPFMGGGTPLLEANRLGCDVIGYDINPMAYWIVRQEIEHLDLAAYRGAVEKLAEWLRSKIGHLHETKCLSCGSADANAKYFLWVKVQRCDQCGEDIDLFPGYLLAQDRRHPRNVFVCPACGALTESPNRRKPGSCTSCGAALLVSGPAKRNQCDCSRCGAKNRYPNPDLGPPRHRMFAIEYYCKQCKPRHRGRFFKKPDEIDLRLYSDAESALARMRSSIVPDDKIPAGDETDRLHRWGYGHYRQMFNDRQLLGLELSCRFIRKRQAGKVRDALATNLSDLLRYQNMLCRYDTMALKSLDIFSVHGFPVGLVQCESNLLGISNGAGGVVGSGGWLNITQKFTRAKQYCDKLFEVTRSAGRKVVVPMLGEWIGEHRDAGGQDVRREVDLRCGSATSAKLPPASLDAVFTDPPYFANVQYAELMDFCYVWLRRLIDGHGGCFQATSTRSAEELTGNLTMDRGLDHFTQGISDVFCRMAKALKPGAPLVFTYHHNTLDAYRPICVGILDAGLTCSASLPCPAEMGASIHISGTGSSILDTVFVCRSTGRVPRRWIAATADEVADLVQADVSDLKEGGVKVTKGDLRCIIFGHLIRLAVWELRQAWQKNGPVEEKLARVEAHIQKGGGPSAVEQCLGDALTPLPLRRAAVVREDEGLYGTREDEIPF